MELRNVAINCVRKEKDCAELTKITFYLYANRYNHKTYFVLSNEEEEEKKRKNNKEKKLFIILYLNYVHTYSSI